MLFEFESNEMLNRFIVNKGPTVIGGNTRGFLIYIESEFNFNVTD